MIEIPEIQLVGLLFALILTIIRILRITFWIFSPFALHEILQAAGTKSALFVSALSNFETPLLSTNIHTL